MDPASEVQVQELIRRMDMQVVGLYLLCFVRAEFKARVVVFSLCFTFVSQHSPPSPPSPLFLYTPLPVGVPLFV